MLFITHWTISQQNLKAAIQRFKETVPYPRKASR